MASTKWIIGLNGNWSNAAFWSAGVPTSATDATIGAFGTYTVTLSSAAAANSLTVNAAGVTLSELIGGSLDVAGALTVESGKVLLRTANTIGSGIILAGGILGTFNNAAFGTNTLTFSGGELFGLGNVAFTNVLAMSGNIIFAAAHGTTLTEQSSSWTFDATTPGTLKFGQGANDGTVVWYTTSGSITNPLGFSVEVSAGTLRGGDSSFGFLLENAAAVTIDTGATIDMAGFSGSIDNLEGSGVLTSTSVGSTVSTFGGGNFVGVIASTLGLDVNGGTLTLTGANTYTGGTTIETGSTLQLGNGGTRGSIAGDIADNGTLIYDHSSAQTVTAGISGTGGVTFEGGGAVTVNRAETYSGATTLTGELATTNNGSGFGTGTLTLDNSELVVTASQTMANSRVTYQGNSTFAAGHGKTVTNSGAWTLDGSGGGATLNFGDATNDGTIVWLTGAGSTVVNIADDFVEVHSGTLRAGDSSFSFLTQNVGGLTIDAGATVDMTTFSGFFVGLQGTGNLTAHNSATIDIEGGDFGGVISGACSVVIDDGTILTGANTYSLGTTIGSTASLSLGNGGTTGTIVGNIVDNGALIIDRSDAVSETGAISGSGDLIQLGTGTTTIARAETYSGGTMIAAGELSIDRATAIGTGAISVLGGEFLVTQNAVLSNQLNMSGDITLAAATGTQLNFNSSAGWRLDASAPTALTFGDATNKGTIIWHTPAGSSITNIDHYTVDVHTGVLKAADSSFGFLLSNAASTTVDTGAAINMNGFTTDFGLLLGAGQITDTGAAATAFIESGNFAGTINGAISQVQLSGTSTISGSGNFTGEFFFGGTLTLSGTWTQNVEFSGAATLIDLSPATFSGHIVSYGSGDVIDVRGVDFNSASFSETYNTTTGVLTLADGTHTSHVTFNGGYVQGNFTASADGHAGTDVTFSAVAGAHPGDVQPPVLASEHPDYALF